MKNQYGYRISGFDMEIAARLIWKGNNEEWSIRGELLIQDNGIVVVYHYFSGPGKDYMRIRSYMRKQTNSPYSNIFVDEFRNEIYALNFFPIQKLPFDNSKLRECMEETRRALEYHNEYLYNTIFQA